MRVPSIALRALAVAAASMLPSGCGESLDPGGQSSRLRPPVVRPASLAIGRSDPVALNQDLLYVSSIIDCNVYVLTYPQGKLVQTLNVCRLGFGNAYGLCTDKSGDVFMSMANGFSIFEYVHGGAQPIRQLENTSLLPAGCSVDPTTGNLGIASGAGAVAIFNKASNTYRIYSAPDIPAFYFCTFDDHGNLFADGESNENTFALAELPKGSSDLRVITVPGNNQFGLALQWDGRHVAIEAAQSSNEFTLDRIRISGLSATVVGTTTFAGPPNGFLPFQFWLQGSTIVQAESENAEVGFWHYPRGGQQTKAFQIGGGTFPALTIIGVAVSLAPRHR